MPLRRPGLWASLMVAGVCAAVGIWLASVIVGAESELERQTRQLVAFADAHAARNTSRPVVIGDPIDGNAWDFYSPALESFQTALTPMGWEELWRVWNSPKERRSPEEQARLNDILEHARSSVGLLREGLRRTRVDAEIALQPRKLDIYNNRMLAAGSVLEAIAHLLIEGRSDDAEALDRAAVLLAAAQDMTRGGPLSGSATGSRIETAVVSWSRDLFRSWDAPAADLRRFAERLDTLERGRPSLAEMWAVEDAVYRSIFLETRTLVDYKTGDDLVPGWRCLYSMPVMKVQLLHQSRDWHRQLADAASSAPIEQERLADRISAESDRHANPAIFHYLNFSREAARLWTVPGQMTEETDGLLHRTQLRVAAALAWYEAEHGKDPLHIEELVPAYLPRVPVCPITGKAMTYAPGKFSFPGREPVSGDDDDRVWTVSRKTR